MNWIQGNQIFDKVEEAEEILDNIGNSDDVDDMPDDVTQAIEEAWRATQKARKAVEKWIKTLGA